MATMGRTECVHAGRSWFAGHVRQVIIQDSEVRAVLLQPLQPLTSRAGDVNRIPMGSAPEECCERVAVLNNEGPERGLRHAAGEQVTHMGT